MRAAIHCLLVLWLLGAPRHGPSPAYGQSPAERPAAAARPAPPPSDRVLLIENGAERYLETGEVLRRGDTVVDLSDRFTPLIFEEPVLPDGSTQENRYRAVYLGLAGDTGDEDGQPLPPGEHNYLELYGIPPTLSVLRARFLAARPCKEVRFEVMGAVRSIGAYIDKPPRTEEDRRAFAEVEKRLACEQLLTPKARHKKGRFDEAFRQSLIRFQRKHMLYDGAAVRPDTLAALARTPLENDHAALLRVLGERVIAAAGIVEDGSVDSRKGPPSYKAMNGERLPVRNLVDEATHALVTQLGLERPEDALAFFRRHPAADFAGLRVAVRLPPRPEYYGPEMDLSVVVDRGDVIYDPPYDEEGKPNRLRRKHFPTLTLRVKWNGQQIPLVRWRTTIGGWRSDLASNGYEYYRYKGSDVGPRVWRNIVSGPVWIAPPSSPVRSLVKWKKINGRSQRVVNYGELGPGYLSAYGLVAAYNVVPGRDGRPDWDNGVRVHGSSEILSIRNPEAYSHGCHRLMNHLAVRLFSFVLRHRAMVIEGDRPLNFSRQFLWRDEVYEIRLPSRGFWYRLEPPLPVMVLEGNVLGEAKKPISAYLPKAGVEYPPGPPPSPTDSPESRAGGGE